MMSHLNRAYLLVRTMTRGALLLSVLFLTPCSWAEVLYEADYFQFDEREIFQWGARGITQLKDTNSLNQSYQLNGIQVTEHSRFSQKDKVQVEEIVPVLNPFRNERPLSELIFNSSLSKEFTQKYKDDFGHAAGESLFEVYSNKYSTSEYIPGHTVTVEKIDEKQRVYGEYVIKRLTEVHLDDFTRNTNGLRNVHAIKEQLSNANLKMGKDFQMNMNYSISQNAVALSLSNPLNISTKYTLEMGSGSGSGSSGAEQVVSLGYSLSKTTAISTKYKANADEFTLKTEKYFRPTLVGHVTGTSGPSTESSTEEKVIFGFTWIQ